MIKKKKVHLNEVTLVCISGIKRFRSLLSLIRSSRKIRFAKVVFITPKPRIRHIFNINLLDSGTNELDSIDAYNYFCIYELAEFIDTEHCLVIQYDSGIVNADCWSKEFLKYDYIGAPWPKSEFAYIDPFGNQQRVGNGGFSLRSRKLLNTPQRLEIPWRVNSGSFYHHAGLGLLSEDGNICVHNRHLFEKAGCKFAPLSVAIYFAKELEFLENFGVRPFGYHRYNPNSFNLKKIAKRLIQIG